MTQRRGPAGREGFIQRLLASRLAELRMVGRSLEWAEEREVRGWTGSQKADSRWVGVGAARVQMTIFPGCMQIRCTQNWVLIETFVYSMVKPFLSNHHFKRRVVVRIKNYTHIRACKGPSTDLETLHLGVVQPYQHPPASSDATFTNPVYRGGR